MSKEVRSIQYHDKSYVDKIISMIEGKHFKNHIDLACGDGTITKEFVEFCDNISGVDKDDEGLALIKQRIPKGKFWKVDLAKETVKGEYDLVTCIGSIHNYVSGTDNVLRNIKATSIPGGYVIITTNGAAGQYEKVPWLKIIEIRNDKNLLIYFLKRR